MRCNEGRKAKGVYPLAEGLGSGLEVVSADMPLIRDASFLGMMYSWQQGEIKTSSTTAGGRLQVVP